MSETQIPLEEFPLTPADIQPLLKKCQSISDFPKLFDTHQVLGSFLDSGVLKKFDKKKTEKDFLSTFLSRKNHDLVSLLFWQIFIVKFKSLHHYPDNLHLMLKEQIALVYSRLFSKKIGFKEDPQANLWLFCDSYVCHYLFHVSFPKFRLLFNMRFILDCYHIVLYQTTGNFVSDKFVTSLIEKTFTHLFLSYKFDKQFEIRKTKMAGQSYFDLNFSDNRRKRPSFYSPIWTDSDNYKINTAINYVHQKKLGVKTLIDYDSIFTIKKHLVGEENEEEEEKSESKESLVNIDDYQEKHSVAYNKEMKEIERRKARANLTFELSRISPAMKNFLNLKSDSLPRPFKSMKKAIKNPQIREARDVVNELGGKNGFFEMETRRTMHSSDRNSGKLNTSVSVHSTFNSSLHNNSFKLGPVPKMAIKKEENPPNEVLNNPASMEEFSKSYDGPPEFKLKFFEFFAFKKTMDRDPKKIILMPKRPKKLGKIPREEEPKRSISLGLSIKTEQLEHEDSIDELNDQKTVTNESQVSSKMGSNLTQFSQMVQSAKLRKQVKRQSKIVSDASQEQQKPVRKPYDSEAELVVPFKAEKYAEVVEKHKKNLESFRENSSSDEEGGDPKRKKFIMNEETQKVEYLDHQRRYRDSYGAFLRYNVDQRISKIQDQIKKKEAERLMEEKRKKNLLLKKI